MFQAYLFSTVQNLSSNQHISPSTSASYLMQKYQIKELNSKRSIWYEYTCINIYIIRYYLLNCVPRCTILPMGLGVNNFWMICPQVLWFLHFELRWQSSVKFKPNFSKSYFVNNFDITLLASGSSLTASSTFSAVSFT